MCVFIIISRIVFATALSLSTHYRVHTNCVSAMPPPMMPTTPIATPIATSAHIGGSFGLGPPHAPSHIMLGHTHHQGISMMHTHTQRLHPY